MVEPQSCPDEAPDAQTISAVISEIALSADGTAELTAGEPTLLDFDTFDGSDYSTSPRSASHKASPRPSRPFESAVYETGIVSAVAARLDSLLERFS